MARKRRSNRNQLQRICRSWCGSEIKMLRRAGFAPKRSALTQCVRSCKRIPLKAHQRLRSI